MEELLTCYSVSKKVLRGFLIKKHVKSIIYSYSIVKLLSEMTIIYIFSFCTIFQKIFNNIFIFLHNLDNMFLFLYVLRIFSPARARVDRGHGGKRAMSGTLLVGYGYNDK